MRSARLCNNPPYGGGLRSVNFGVCDGAAWRRQSLGIDHLLPLVGCAPLANAYDVAFGLSNASCRLFARSRRLVIMTKGMVYLGGVIELQ